MRQITRGAAANAGLIFHVFVMDSASTAGAGKASVAYSSFACRYIRNGEAISGAITPEDISTIGTYAAPTANTNIRIKAVDNTNMIGVYEVQIHADWVNTTNTCQSLTIYLTATGVAVLPLQIPLIAANMQVAIATAADNAAAVWDLDATAHQTQGTFGQALGDPAADANTIYGAVVTGAAGATVAADIIAIKAETASIQTDTNTLETEVGKIPKSDGTSTWNNTALAAIEQQCADALGVYDGPTNAELATALGTADDAVLAEVAKIPKSDGSVIFNATCVGNIKSGLSTQAELDKVPKSDGTTTWNSTALGSIQSEATDALNAYDGPTNAELATALGTADDAVLAAIADLPTNSELATALGTADDAVLAAIADLPTNSELATALGTADDAVLAAIGALNDFDPATDVVAHVTLVDTITTYTGNTKQTADVATLITTVGVAGAGLTAADDAVLVQVALVKAVTDQLAQSVKTIVEGTCAALGTTTLVIASSLSPASAVNDQFLGRIIIFTEDTTTAALRGQATDITAYVHATKTFTCTSSNYGSCVK